MDAAYAKMVTAASRVVMAHRGRQFRHGIVSHVLLAFPKTCKFAKGFPKLNVYSRDGDTITYRLNASSLLNWLYDNGHSAYNVEMLVKQTKRFQYLDKELDRMLGVT